MSTERQLQAALAHLEQDLDGFVGAAFVDLESGRTLAAHSVLPECDLSPIVAAGRISIEAQLAALTSTSHSSVEEIIVLVTGHIYFYSIVTQSAFLCLVADSDETNLALVKSVVAHRVGVISRTAAPQGADAPLLPQTRVAHGNS